MQEQLLKAEMIKKSAIKNIRRKNLEVKIYKIFDVKFKKGTNLIITIEPK